MKIRRLANLESNFIFETLNKLQNHYLNEKLLISKLMQFRPSEAQIALKKT